MAVWRALTKICEFGTQSGHLARLVPQGSLRCSDRSVSFGVIVSESSRPSPWASGCCCSCCPLPIIITVAVIRRKLKRGQRTAEGRAVCDQVEGFRTYLATAEADQLKFEEGEDIFSKYLPWAIIFELADRWAKICGDLMAMGRLPTRVPYWYVGNYQMAAFNTSFLTSSLTSAATPLPSSSGASGTASVVAAPSAEAASPAVAVAGAARQLVMSADWQRTVARQLGCMVRWESARWCMASHTTMLISMNAIYEHPSLKVGHPGTT